MGKVALKLNGKPLELHPPPRPMTDLKAILDKSKPDEIFTGEELAPRIGIKAKTLRERAPEYLRSIPGYSITIRNDAGHTVRYWGHPKAIAELKRQTA